MISSIDNTVYSLIQSEPFFKREVTSRIVAVATLALLPLEVAFRILDAALDIATYIISKPISLAARIIRVIRDPTYKEQFSLEEKADFGRVLKTISKVLICAVNILISPPLAAFSPRRNIEWHVFCGLTVLEQKKPQVVAPICREVLSAEVKKGIDEKFATFYLNKENRNKLREYGLEIPHSCVLHGPSMSANRRGAEYIASQLDREFKELDLADSKEVNKFIDNFKIREDIVYVDLKKNDVKKINIILDKFDELNVIYILGSKLPVVRNSVIHIEIPLPDESTRKEILQRELSGVPIQEGFDFSKVAQVSSGCKMRTIEKMIQTLKFTAFQAKSKITTDAFLEIISIKNKQSVQAPAVSDFVGMDELHEKFDLYLEVLKNPNDAKEYGVKLPAGMLLYGPPGCGKTYTAKHLGEYAQSKGVKLNFCEINGSDVVGKWKGEGINNIKRIFEEAKKNAPTILFIDECEGLLPSRDKLKDTLSVERTQELDEALKRIEEAKLHNVIVIGATNNISAIDSAILRTGRFDYTFEVKPPNSAMRLKMFEAKLKLKKCEPDIDLTQLVEITEGFTASDIDTIVNDAGLTSWKNRSPIKLENLMESFKVIQAKRSSVDQESANSSSQAPIMTDLKKGWEALRMFMENLESVNPPSALANDLE